MIEWERIASELGTLQDGQERGSSALAKLALEKVLGEQHIREAVDHYIGFKPGFELVRSVLWQIRPFSAAVYCYELSRTARHEEVRRSAVELLRVVADARALPWVREFLEDPDEVVQAWGAGVLDQLLWGELVEAGQAEQLLSIAETHPNERVRETAAFVRGYLNERKQDDA